MTLPIGLQELLNADFRTVIILTAPLLMSPIVLLVAKRSSFLVSGVQWGLML